MTSQKLVGKSIWKRLIVGLVSVSVLAAAATSIFIYQRFNATNSAFRDRTLQNDAHVIGKLLRKAADGKPLQLPDFLADNFQQGKGKFAVLSDNGVLIASSPGVTEALAPIDYEENRDFFLSDADHEGRKLYGFTLRGTYGARPVWIQVATPESDIVYDSVLEEFVEDVGWIWIPFVIGLLAINLFVARVGLEPLRTAAAQAESIGPAAVSTRLPENGLPIEVLALVRAVNRAFDRIETAFQSQQRFIADAAHELRTPIAVLKVHASILPQNEEIAALKDEITAIERLVNQLLDAARLDAIVVDPHQTVDLNEVSQTVAQLLGPVAINRGKSIEVIATDGPALITGSGDILGCALRNLVENGIRFTAKGTAVSIQVIAPSSIRVADHGPGIMPQDRENIFKRFWQGGRDRGGGAGLGMDIVARTVNALGGTIEIQDTPGGGTAFLMSFPQPAI